MMCKSKNKNDGICLCVRLMLECFIRFTNNKIRSMKKKDKNEEHVSNEKINGVNRQRCFERIGI